jgi:NhaP-type Na+/H+ or K+/H+ antiporter
MRTIAYLFTGLLISLGLALAGVGHISPIGDHGLLSHVCDLALIVAVFGSGLAVERRVRRSSWWLIGLLIVVGMPATIAAVALIGSAAMGLGLGAAVLLGAVLAPTDPVLAGDVGLGTPGEDELGEPRLSLHTEAGANDGLASPFVLAGLFIATHHGTGWIGRWLAVDLAYRVGVAVVLGAVCGTVAVAAITRLRDRDHGRGRYSPSVLGVLALAAAFAINAACAALGGYALVAVFVAGIAFRRGEADDALHAEVHGIFERAGSGLELVVIVLLGTTLTTAGLAVAGGGGWLVAGLLIVVVRPLVVLVVSVGSPLRLSERLFLGFFGVRGVAAIYYAAVLAGTGALSARATAVVVWTTLLCVAVSVVVHGLSAAPLMRRWLTEP